MGFKYGPSTQQPGYRQTAQQPYQMQRPAAPAPAPAPAPQSFAPPKPAYQPASTAPAQQPANQVPVATPAPTPAPTYTHPAPNQQAPGTVPQNNGYQQPNAAPESQPAPVATDFISNKIYKINGKDKVLDFSSRCTAAKIKDYANVHGCGGKDHAPNSTVAMTLCDFTKGTGEKSVTTSFNLDVEMVDVLHRAAMDAMMGCLQKDPNPAPLLYGLLNDFSRWEMSAQQFVAVPTNDLVAAGTALGNAVSQTAAAPAPVLSSLRSWLSTSQKAPVCVAPVQEIANAKNAIMAFLQMLGKPAFEYTSEKNNPYAKDAAGNVPVSKVYIAYTPVRADGQISNYPWFVQIRNFKAPLTEKGNGATAHNSSKAFDDKTTSINLSAEDFACALVAVKRFVGVWEMTAGVPVVRNALKAQAAQREAKKNGQTA